MVVLLVWASLLVAQAVPARADAGSASARAAQMAAVAVHPWRVGPDQTPLPFWPLRDPTERERVFSAIQALGVKTARVDLRWDRVEPIIKGLRDWSEFDGIHESAVDHGITLLPMVAMPPGWANNHGSVWTYPTNPQDYEDFMVAALQRYPDIPAWEIWNEPNLADFSQPAVDPAKFVDLLAAAHRAKERAGSSAQIISGGLSSTGVDATQFFEDMIRLHAFDYVDGFGIHPYSPDAPDNPGSFFLGLPRFHDRLVQIGKSSVGVWITEYGAATSTRASPNGPPYGDQEQAARLRSAFAIAARWPWVQNLTWYEFQDLCDDPANFTCNFGLLREDMSPKPASVALAEIAHGNLPKIESRISLARARLPANRRRRATTRPISLRGTLDTAASQGAVGPVEVTMSWSPRPRGRTLKSRTLRPPVSGGRFAATLRNPKPGYWRAVASYPGSSDYYSSTSAPVSIVVKPLPRRR
jgi:hypothetical protein